MEDRDFEMYALRVQWWLLKEHDLLVPTQAIEDAMNEPLPGSVVGPPVILFGEGGDDGHDNVPDGSGP